MPVLKIDVYSYFKKVVCYGKQGDKVTTITISDPVYIVEDKKGQRFPVHVDKLIL